ncbi:DUF3826 domain-containing protein [Chitinophaga sp. GbtcB8]|uniref:DUF3826 domain-containing protein n=1 Tax=Chitinophaga sp. GbtcB8 TaxID=2824753 RepID=UPI0020C73FDE|nr:DUF3826 domain-containing protein [Chitinophaga sp. GbtcB8]
MNRLQYLFLAGCMLATAPVVAQSAAGTDTAYVRVVTQRADKIVASMNMGNTTVSTQVRDIIAQQYQDLNKIQMERETQVKAAKEELKDDKPALDARMQGIEDATNKKLNALHQAYLAKLSGKLNPAQVDQVKDGMTYGVLPLTYGVYMDMMPNLTQQQKAQMMAWLVEAREHAMDAGSSEKKHAWFGKYKGRINNYLSAAGYNMKEVEAGWKKRKGM